MVEDYFPATCCDGPCVVPLCAWTQGYGSRVEAVLMRFLLVVPMEAEVRLIVTAQG